MSDQKSALVKRQIRYAEYKRPVLRALAAYVLLLPIMVRRLETDADRGVLVVLGTICAGNLLYAALQRLKTVATRDDDAGRVSLLLTAFVLLSLLTLAVLVAALFGLWDPALWITLGLLTVAVAAALYVLYLCHPRKGKMSDPLPQPSGYEQFTRDSAKFEGDAIACSGGGIRAAAFCLGGLQRLRTPEQPPGATFYDNADRVYGVSGGGYIATSLHLARRHSDQSADVQADLFSPGSAEEDWLRRKSKFLLPSGSRVAGVLSVLYGIAVNLALLGFTVFLAAWYAGWLHTRVGGVCSSSDPVTAADCLRQSDPAAWQPDTWWVLAGVAVLVFGLDLFLVAKAISKYQPRGPLVLRGFNRVVVVAGAGLALVCVVLPWLIVNLSNATVAGEPTPVLARAMSAARLATPEACRAATEESFRDEAEQAWHRAVDRSEGVPFSYGACGDTWSDDATIFAPRGDAGDADLDVLCARETGARPAFCDDRADSGISGWERLAAWAAAAAALVAAVRGLVRGFGGGGSPGKPSRFSKVAEALRRTVLPWTAVVLLGLVVAVVLLVLTRDNLVDPGRLEPNIHWVWIPLALLLIRGFTDAILSSLHPFYRERLSDTFLIKRGPEPDKEALPLRYQDPTHVHESSATSGPELTVCCVANITDQDYVPAARGCASFLFRTTREGGQIGISDARLPGDRIRGAQAYSAEADPQGLDTTLAAAMATSGAAFSPLAGRQSGRLKPYRVLLALVNARLGVWLPNPFLVDPNGEVAGPGDAPDGRTWWKWAWFRARRPGPYRIFKEAFGALSIYDGRIYVTDGGHYDNTGIVEALRDRPARLVVLDASADPRDSLDALGDAIATARMDLGLVVAPASPRDLEQLRGSVDKETGEYVRPERGWIHLRVSTVGQPEKFVCEIWFVKNVLTKQKSIALETYAAENPAFPLTATVNQFYGEYDFEAYRLLGYTNTTHMLEGMAGFDPDAPAPSPDEPDLSTEESAPGPVLRKPESMSAV